MLYLRFKFDFIFDKIVEYIKEQKYQYDEFITVIIKPLLPSLITSSDQIDECKKLMKIVKYNQHNYIYTVVNNVFSFLR